MDSEKDGMLASNALAVGKDIEKLQWIVLNHLDGIKMREMFRDISKNAYTDEVTCREAIHLLKSINEEERFHSCKSALNLLPNRDENEYVHVEYTLSSIFMFAYEEGVLTLSECCELLILNTDFSLSTPMDTRKFEFMRKNLHLIDYKGLRNILKMLVVERMQEIPANITHSQRQMLLPAENLLLSLIDRKLNLLPCLFTITELHRVSSNSRAFLLPRIAKKFNEMFISFRPLTEMVTVVGRSWLYPIPAHISFPSSTSSWRLEVATTRLHQRAHLPYKSEIFSPQTSLLYTLLRQPRGKDTIAYVLRQNTSGTPPQRVQCDDLLHMIVMDAMSEMEKTVNPLESNANQYQWMNITQTVTFSLLHGNASFSKLLRLFNESLSTLGYRKGRDELMWIILQYVSVYITKITDEDMARIADLYKLLYSDERTWLGVDTDPWQFVRFLTPAAIWVHFYKIPNRADAIPKPLDALFSQVQFLQERTSDTEPIQNIADHNALLAAVANAHSNDMATFQKLVLSSIDVFLDGSSDDLCHLPYGLVCFSKRVPLPFPLIDCLTFHARNHLFQLCIVKISTLLAGHSASKLPSPASIETLVRLAATTEFEYGVKQLLALLSRALSSLTTSGNPQDRSKELVYILCEILCYRLISFPLPVISKVNIILQCHSAVSYPQIQAIFPLYTIMEELLLRYWMWSTPSELSVLCTALFGKQGKFTALITAPTAFCEAPNMSNVSTSQEKQPSALHISPEVLRFILLCMFRGLKMTGSEVPMEVLQRCNASYVWPLSISRTFSAQIPKCTVDEGNVENFVDDIVHILSHDMHQIRDLSYTNSMISEEQLLKYFTGEKKSAIMCVLYTLIIDMKKVHPVYYAILASSSIKEIIVMINRFVDYLMHIFRRNPPTEDSTFTAMVSVINDMVFTHQIIPLERLLLSLILHPTDDRSIEYSMLIIHSMVTIFPDLRSRIVAVCRYVPSNKIVNTNISYLNKMVDLFSMYPEFTYREMEAKRRYEVQKDIGLRSNEIFVNPENHLPIYYGNIVERILPIIDMLLVRALDPVVSEQLFTSLLSAFKPIYKFHPQPTSFLYNILYTQDQCVLHSSKARFFVLEICSQLEERDGGFSIISSAKFDNHPTQLCQQLVARVIQASFYPHEPPPFAQKDWRFAELPPSSQALLGACIELLISPHNPSIITRSLIDIALVRPLQQPYAVINTVALILTSLPPPYQHIFYDHLVSILNSDALLEGDPSVCFDSLENECFLLNENQLITNLALGHAYLQHCNTSSLGALPDFVREHLAPKLTNEAQLLFVLRLVIPILQRFYDAKERSKQIQDLAVDVYKMTVRVNEMVGSLKYEDSICDLLYHMKYMYVGDFVRNEAEQAIQRLSPSMQEKLKYITHSQAMNPDANVHK